jgi:uncharacterized protein YbjT (DUF2867 family)
MGPLRIAILGGTGFIGRHLCARLTKDNHFLTVFSRHPTRHFDVEILPTVKVIGVDVYDRTALTQALSGYDAVINLIGILNEKGHDGSGFYKAHVTVSKILLEAMQPHRITRLLHVSALGASLQSVSYYLKTKAEAENLVHQAATDTLRVTSFQPAVVFGEGDTFLNRFAALLRLSPGIFFLPCADALYTPLYVGDLVEIMAQTLTARHSFSQRYALGGPRAYSLKTLVEYVTTLIGCKRWVVGLPDGLSRLLAHIMEYVPGKPFSVDNYLSARTGAVCYQPLSPIFNVHLHALETIAPLYLGPGAFENTAARSRQRMPTQP